MIWAFVDYENLGSLEQVDLALYQKVFVFLGPNHKRLNLGSLPGGEFSSLELIRIPSSGNNNLDFHLSFYLGRLDGVTDPAVAFHVLSRDKGFDGVIGHLTSRGRQAKRDAPPAPSPPAAKKSTVALSKPAQAVVKKLKEIDGRTRPRKESSLLNWLNSESRLLNGAEAESVISELRTSGKLQVQDGAVKYTL